MLILLFRIVQNPIPVTGASCSWYSFLSQLAQSRQPPTGHLPAELNHPELPLDIPFALKCTETHRKLGYSYISISQQPLCSSFWKVMTLDTSCFQLRGLILKLLEDRKSLNVKNMSCQCCCCLKIFCESLPLSLKPPLAASRALQEEAELEPCCQFLGEIC